MDYRPVSSRTRLKRDEALLEDYRKMKNNSGVGSSSSTSTPSRSKKIRSDWASVCDNGESSSWKRSFDSEEISGKQGRGKRVVAGVKRRRSLGLDVSVGSNKDGCDSIPVSDCGEETTVEVIDLVDTDDEDEVIDLVDTDGCDSIPVSTGEERRGGDNDDDDDDDDVSESESDVETVSSADVDDSNEESLFSSEEDTTEEEIDEECAPSSSDVDTSGEQSEEEIELTEKREKAVEGESVEVGLKRKRNADGDDLHSASGHDIDDRSEKGGKVGIVEVGLEGKRNDDDGNDLLSSSGHDADVRSEEVWKEENVGVGLKGNRNADGDDLDSSSCHDIDDRSEKVGIVEVGLEGKRNDDLLSSSGHDADVRSEKEWKEEIVGVGLMGKRNADGDDLHSSSVHDIDDRSEKVGKAESVSAEEKTGWDNRDNDGKTGCDYIRNDDNGQLKTGSETVSANRRKDDNNYKGKTGTDGCKTWSNKWNRVQKDSKKSEGASSSSLIKKKSTSAPKQKRLPTVAFEPPTVEFLPLRFSFGKEPTVREKSDQERAIDELFDEFEFAKSCENGSTDSKAKENNDVNDETYGGSPEVAFDNGRATDVPTAFKNLSFSNNDETRKDDNDETRKDDNDETRKDDNDGTRKDDNDETYGDSSLEPCNKNEGVRKFTEKKSITAPKNCNAFMILVNSIYDEGELSGEQLAPFGNESPKDEAPKDEPLPLFFTLGHPPSPPPEKSALEKEVDSLFDEFDFVRRSSEIGSTDSNVVETNDSVPLGKEVTQHILCSQGKHSLILDEEVGQICKFCSHVHLEIKYIVPEFAPNPYGKASKRFYEDNNQSILDDLQCNGPDNSGSNSYAHAEGTVWDLIPGLESDLYPHQRQGFEFIWSHIAGGIQLGKLAKPSAYGGDGCIISHAPGTGKTRLTIVFIQSYMNFNPTSRPLIVAPRTMLLTWEEEFKKWGFDIPFHNLNSTEFTGKEDEAARNLVKDVKSREIVNSTRIVKLKSWTKKRSILGISYSLFEKICGAPTKEGKLQLRERQRFEADQMRKILTEFPGLVVFDEGHNPRNDESNSWNALLQLKTRRRIILSGTPFQNNFEELYNTVRLVRPEWATNLTCIGAFDKKQRTSDKMRGKKSQVGTDENTKRAKEVRAMISHFVHVYKGTILQDKLPGLRNSVLVLQPTDLQQRFFNRTRCITNAFLYDRIEAQISIHPSLLLREVSSISNFLKEDECSGDWDILRKIKLNPEGGVKARFTVDLIRLCQTMNERVLVFSQWIDPLILIRDMLKSQFQWVEGNEVVYMDGKCDAKQRQSSMSVFNDPSSKAKVLLASTRGCNEGINLVGASRVVLLDVTWNPAVERQAISRAYRLGQKKIVFIYHLLMAGAREEKKYSRQVEKHRLSELVFSCSDREADAKKIPAVVAEDKVLEEMVQHEKLQHIFQKITLLDEASYLDEEFE